MAMDIDLFFEQLKIKPNALLFIDYDGTLAPFAIERDKALPYEGVQTRIEKLLTVGKTKVIIVTGRAVQDLLTVFHANPMPEIWGSHGGEKLEGNEILSFKDPLAMKGITIAKKLTIKQIDPKQCELKPLSIAVHWRGLDGNTKKILEKKTYEIWNPLLEKFPLEILPFNEGLEIRQKGIGKARAVNIILENEKDSLVAYIGDDFTDEQAFDAIGNRGLKVLISKKQASTIADLQISSVNDLFDFLDHWLSAREELP